MPRKKRWNIVITGNGKSEVKLLSWKYFMDFVYQIMLEYDTYIWRGHHCDNWMLEPTLDRLVKKAKIAKAKRYHFRRKHLEEFKYAVRGRRGPNPSLIVSDNEWWALGQHHGLATPLLDWTTSPFVGAYFAFIGNEENQTKYRAIYALHKPNIEIAVHDLKRVKELAIKQKKEDIAAGRIKLRGLIDKDMLGRPVLPQVEFIRPLSDENQHLVNQSGLFTRSPDGVTLDKWVEENNDDDRGSTLIKILIPNSDRDNCLKTLNRMNINHLTLFPDLYGASKFCNLFAEIEKY